MRSHQTGNDSVTVIDSDSPIFHALADPTRRGILAMVARRACPVREIAAAFAVSRPAISKHLAVLRHAGLLKERASGRERFQEFDAGPLLAAIAELEQLVAAVPRKQPSVRPDEDDWRCW